MQRHLRTIALLGLVSLTTGCGVELTAGGFREGEVRAVATSEDGQQESSTALAPGVHRVSYALDGVLAEAQGTLDFDVEIALLTAAGDVARLTPAPRSTQLRLEAGPEEVARAQVEARTYARARVEFHRIEGEITGGIEIGGVPLLGPIRVAIGQQETVVVEAPVQLRVEEDQTHTLVIDLNADQWLASANPLTGVITAADFAAAVDLHTR